MSLCLFNEFIQRHWNPKKSVQENFDQLGLKLTLNPSFKHSKEGIDIKKQFYEDEAALKGDEEDDEDEQIEYDDEEESYDEEEE